MSGSGKMYCGGESSTFQSEDLHLLDMEYLSLFNPFCDSGRDRRHGENHGGELLVKSKGELVDEGNVISDSCFRSKILEVSDVFLESIVCDFIGAFELLGELEQVIALVS